MNTPPEAMKRAPFWEHNCPVDGPTGTEKGEACNSCGAVEQAEQPCKHGVLDGCCKECYAEQAQPYGWYIDGYGAVLGKDEPKSVRPGQWSPFYTEAPRQPEQAQPIAHCEAGPEFCQQCHKESKPTYGSEEVRKLREVIESQARIITLLEREQAQPYEIEWPVYHEQAMGCGLEDRDEHCRYGAMRYGWDCAIEAVAQAIPDVIYTAPPPRQPWVDLTPEDRAEIRAKSASLDGAINATANKLKEKNA